MLHNNQAETSEVTDHVVVVQELPREGHTRRAAILAVGAALQVSARVARSLVRRTPVTLPKRFSYTDAARFVASLTGLGALVELRSASNSSSCFCHIHAAFDASNSCQRCRLPICALCVATSEDTNLCEPCIRRSHRSQVFLLFRLIILLGILTIVIVYAFVDVSGRRARTQWRSSLTVAMVIVRMGQVNPQALTDLVIRSSVLEDKLAMEYGRYRSGSFSPFRFVHYGPVDAISRAPSAPDSGLLSAARYGFELWKYRRAIDKMVGLDERGVDAALYVVVRPPQSSAQKFMEGASQQGGKVGIVEVELDATMVDVALFVAAHELFHVLGATDKYDAAGRVSLPAGLADPEQIPLYPQRKAEVMARNVAVGPDTERVPDTLEELAVGVMTAREVGWIQ